MRDLLGYEDGVEPSEFFALYQSTLKKTAERKRDQVENFAIALGSLFDGKLIKRFNDGVQEVIQKLDDLKPKGKPARTPLKKMSKDERRAAMAHTMQELGKLDRLFSGNWDGWEGDA